MENGETKKQDNEILLGIAEDLRKKNLDTQALLQAIQDTVVEHSWGMEHPYEAKSILESRFTSSEEAYKKGMISCGAMTNIGAVILRDLGYAVRLVHGSIPTSKDHAWLKVKEGEVWKEYDLTNGGNLPREGRIIKNECSSWEEIRNVIEAEYGVGVHKDKI